MDDLEYVAARVGMAYEKEFRTGEDEDIFFWEGAMAGQMYDIWH